MILGCLALTIVLYTVPEDLYTGYIPDVMTVLDDDMVEQDVELLITEYEWILVLFLGVCCLISLMGIWGAVKYNGCMVLLAALWGFILGLLVTVVIGLGGLAILVAGLYAYPSIVFYQELSEGIMTADNYHNEIHSCCCVNRKKGVSIQDAIENRLGVFA